jgi:hypothetical protein
MGDVGRRVALEAPAEDAAGFDGRGLLCEAAKRRCGCNMARGEVAVVISLFDVVDGGGGDSASGLTAPDSASVP